METITYIAPSISCEHCRRAIEGAVDALPGVQAVHVDIPSKINYDPAQLDHSTIESTLDEEGYSVQSK